MTRSAAIRRLALLSVLVAGLLGAVVGAQEKPAGGPVLLVDVEGAIGPASQRHLADALGIAAERDAEALILRLDTPGGLVTSTRTMIADILASPVPVVGYVAPPGAHAASAGTYLMYATHVAAMAPGTNMGAATPVQMGGGAPGMPQGDGERPERDSGTGDPGKEGEGEGDGGSGPAADAMSRKAVNDAVAWIRSLAELRGRNADWAERAVREAASVSATQARELNVVEIVAEDLDALLQALDGRTVKVDGREVTLATAGATVETLEPDLLTLLLGVIANPNVAFILMMIGIYGLIFEFASPGSIGPGVVGAICLVLGLYALNQLPLNYAGLGLLLLGLAFMVAEAFTPTLGVLGFGGLVAFVIGSAMLVDTDVPAFQLSWAVIGLFAALSAGFMILVIGFFWRSRRAPQVAGAEGMVGARGEVLQWQGEQGYVWAEGERWHARADRALERGAPVRIRALDGLTLIVDEAPPESGGAERPGNRA